MAYVMRNPFGEAENVETLERALEICTEFDRGAAYIIRKVEAAKSVDDDLFDGFDLIVKNWNHNVAVIARMEADPHLKLGEKKARYIKLAQNILEMTKACAEPPRETKAS